jgi:hypothetical protein
MITKEIFSRRFGREPVHDDLERVNCNRVGELGHWQCGVCPDHDKPRFECGCLAPRVEPKKRRGEW